jgi:ATP-dependent RNA helicase DHX30
VLQTYSQDEKVEEFLSQMPEPPPPESVTQAVHELINLGALDEDEKLTPLGRRIAMFTTHPKLSKALVHAAVFRYLYLES